MTTSMTRRKKHQSNNDGVLYAPLEVDEHMKLSNKRKKRKRKRKVDDEPFLITNIKVGAVIAAGFVLLYLLYVISSMALSSIRGLDGGKSGSVGSKYVNDDAKGYTGEIEIDEKSKTFPNFDINDGKLNAFSAAKHLRSNSKGGTSSGSDERDPKKKSIWETLDELEKLKQEFAATYGGENAAKEILNRGIITFTSSLSPPDNVDTESGLQNTARRIFNSKNENKPFKMSFAGSGAIAGYGNYLKQTFPSVIVDILTEPMGKLGVELEIRNAAVADISSFPYGWCLENFMGEEVDVVSWDTSLSNRADTDAAFEAYLRRVITMDSSPMLIIREGSYSESRRQMLQTYVDSGALVDPIVININAAAEPFLDLHEDIVPVGFQDWLEFGVPDGAPGKVRSGRNANLSIKQHELIAWLLSMHFIAAIELGAANMLGLDEANVGGDWLKGESSVKIGYLPKPQTSNIDHYSPLMFGRPLNQNTINATEWQMDSIYCSTTFEPIVSGDLQELIVSGSSNEDLDILLPRGPMLYNKNWIMDLGVGAKLDAFAFKKYDFDYRFQKKAYYGVRPSGSLTLFIPYVDKVGKWKKKWGISFGKKRKPSDAISSIIVCEVNEHIGEKQCDMVKSMGYLVGGVSATPRYITSNGVSYQGKKNCVQLDMPIDTKWTTRKKVEKEIAKKPSGEKRNDSKSDGISLQVSVTDELLFWKNGPCSISHVLWEQLN